MIMSLAPVTLLDPREYMRTAAQMTVLANIAY